MELYYLKEFEKKTSEDWQVYYTLMYEMEDVKPEILFRL